ncbi:class I adenylate-forming enzyme family protein [Peribacillus butanolivorans]
MVNIVEETHFNRKMRVFKNRPLNLFSMLEETVSKFPDKEALVENTVRLTYKEMYEKVLNISGNLQKSLGVKKGERVALLLGNSIEYALLVFACAKIGVILVLLNTRLKEKELYFMLKQSGARILIVDDEFLYKVDKMRNENVISKAMHFYLIGEQYSKRKDYLPYEILEQKAISNPVDISENDPLFIMYTSGTTGQPKGAIGSHLGAIHSSMNFENVFKTDQNTKTLIAVPLFHVTGLIGQLFHTIRVGGTSVILKRFHAEEYIWIMKEEKISLLFNVPTIYVMMMAHPSFQSSQYMKVKTLAYGGAPMSPETICELTRYFPNAALQNAYGATETSSPATIMPRYYNKEKRNSVGIAVPVGDLKVVNNEGDNCMPGVVGELLIKGPMVIEGYWENEMANQSAFIDGYWRSGDLAKIDEDGFIYIMDRKKDMINRGGEKVYSVEVENVIYTHPKVLEVAVVGIPDEIFGEMVKAFIVTKENIVLEKDEIIEFTSKQLASYKVPKEIEFVSELPRNPGGKVLKNRLKNA